MIFEKDGLYGLADNQFMKALYHPVPHFIQKSAERVKSVTEEYAILTATCKEIETLHFIANKKDSFTKNVQQADKSAYKPFYKILKKGL